jgi:hypothetical protein
MSDIGRDYYTASAGRGYYIIYFGKDTLEDWAFSLPIRNSGYGRVAAGTRFKVEIIDTWGMTIEQCPTVFETTAEIDYRVYDTARKRVRLPSKPYIALRVTGVDW